MQIKSNIDPITLPEGRLDPVHCVFRHTMRTARAVASVFDMALAESGLTGHQFNLLMTLYRAGPSTVGALAALVGMSPSTIPRTIQPMLEKGWVSIAQGRDRRQRIIAMAPPGRDVLADGIIAWSVVQDKMLTRAGDESWVAWRDMLKSLRAAAMRTDG